MAGPPGLGCFLLAERQQESGDNYRAVNPSGHYGAYQFGISTWQDALRLATLAYSTYWYMRPDQAPPVIQDAAAAALMTSYYYSFGQSWYNVAEAWYGGPGAVGHPDWGGGVGYPNVGQYAAQVMARYRACSGAPAPPPAGPAPSSPLNPGWSTGFAAFYVLNLQPIGKQARADSRYLGRFIVPAP